MKRLFIAGLVVLALIGIFAFGLHFLNSSGPAFPGLVGPSSRTVIPPPVASRIEEYSQGSESRLAVVLTDKSAEWLGIAHGLKSIGIPFILTDDWNRALRHQVVLVYPELRESRMATNIVQRLDEFVARGGTLIGQQVYGAKLSKLFGIETTNAKRGDSHLRLLEQSFPEFSEPEERSVPVASKGNNNVGVFAYAAPSSEILATYEDGAAAIVRTQRDKGLSYAIGIDLGHLFLKGFNDRQENIAPSYVNHYVPVIDVFLRMLKRIYQEGQKNAVVLSPVPHGKALSVLITHDIDYSHSLANAPQYAAFEKEQGIKATYFVQTKYMSDWNDVGYFDEAAEKIVKGLEQSGGEIASHTVCHSRIFNKIPLGDGNESYPSYFPFVKSATECDNCSILGELRVSKFLLDSMAAKPVVSFRPGHLRNPYVLPQALAATGYSFSSATTANDSLTHLPFRLNYSRDTTAQTPIYEFPITVEDEAEPPMLARLDSAIALAHKLSRYGALFNVLIHPEIVGQKLEFEKGFIKAVRDIAWFGTLREFGDFWAARDAVSLDVSIEDEKVIVEILGPVPVSGLTLEVPAGLTMTRSQVVNAKQVGQKVIIESLFGNARIEFAQTATAD